MLAFAGCEPPIDENLDDKGDKTEQPGGGEENPNGGNGTTDEGGENPDEGDKSDGGAENKDPDDGGDDNGSGGWGDEGSDEGELPDDSDNDGSKPKNNQLWYTSADGAIIHPFSGPAIPDNCSFGVDVVSNSYEGDKWVITFAGPIRKIAEYAFSGCTRLTGVTMPDSVTAIEMYSFNDCINLSEVNFPGIEVVVRDYAFGGCEALRKINISGKAYFGIGAFWGCENLVSINVPKWSDQYISYETFRYCSSLTSITLPDGLTSIGDAAFDWCTSLSSVTMGDKVQDIGRLAFAYCESLREITIPGRVDDIGEWAFRDCVNLQSIYCRPTTPPDVDGIEVFLNNGQGRKIYVPTESVDAYKNAPIWSYYADAIEGYNF